ncbi:transcriptional regulator, GntR family [Aidingimonas halophila]|uniref:Transcriptional regulator, GntR family n=2 Tax=Aidingimonas halophila TaxID=574349 RepID=A0A1H3GRY5_9GAMM|nr:GntR family transcriptional regulator [Aidingimonas halophila]SDY06041.1 transcriptional regulator, GntR family [Aidingimonas halophila]
MAIGNGSDPTGRAPRLHEQIASELQRRIARGRFQQGDRLTEVGIANDFGVSRATVRNAFKSLERLGVLNRTEHRGVTVAPTAQPAFQANQDDDAPDEHAALINTASWESIYQDVSRQAVARSAYGAWRIIETELAASYGVSRTVAREVLARLEHVGILRKDQRGRWLLPRLTAERITQLYEMRWILEPKALRHAAPNLPRRLLDDMQHELDAVLSQPEIVLPQEYDRLEKRLHVELLSYGDNQILIETLQHYHALLIANAHLYDTTPSAYDVDPFMEEHLAIVQTLQAGQPDNAAGLLEDHLRGALDRVLGRIDYMVRHKSFDPLPYLKPLSDGTAT